MRRPDRRELLAQALPAALGALVALPALSWPVSTLDEAILLVYPQRMLEGDLPFRDFFAAYGPTFWWGLTGWYSLTGLTVLSMRLLGLVLHVALVLGTYRMLRAYGSRGSAGLGASFAAVLLFRLGANPYAWVVATTLSVWQLALVRRRPLAAGVLAGLAIGVRPDVALIALVPPLVVLVEHRGRWAVGVALGLVPVWLTLLVSPVAMVEQILLGRAGEGAGQSRLPNPPPGAADRRLLAVLLAAVLIAVVWAVCIRARHATALALLAALALPQALQRADYTHFVYAGLLVLPLLPLALDQLLARLPDPVIRPTAVGTLLAAALFVTAVPEIPRNLVDLAANGNMIAETVRHDGRSLPEAPARAAVFGELLPAIDALTDADDTVFVFDANLVRPAVNEVSLYYYLPGLRQNAFHMEITPGITTEEGSGLVDDVMAARLVVLVRTPEAERRQLFPYATGGSDEARQALAAHFCSRRVIDRYELWQRCA
jgi:hypothetical protein